MGRISEPMRKYVTESLATLRDLQRKADQIAADEKAESAKLEKKRQACVRALDACEDARVASEQNDTKVTSPRRASVFSSAFNYFGKRKPLTKAERDELRKDLVAQIQDYKKEIAAVNSDWETTRARKTEICVRLEEMERECADQIQYGIRQYLVAQKDRLMLVSAQCTQLAHVLARMVAPEYPTWNEVPFKKQRAHYTLPVTLAEIEQGRFRPPPGVPVFATPLADQKLFLCDGKRVPMALQTLLADIEARLGDDPNLFDELGERDLDGTQGDVSYKTLLERTVYVREKERQALDALPGAPAAQESGSSGDAKETEGAASSEAEATTASTSPSSKRKTPSGYTDDDVKATAAAWAEVPGRIKVELLRAWIAALNPPLIPQITQDGMRELWRNTAFDEDARRTQMDRLVASLDVQTQACVFGLSAAVTKALRVGWKASQIAQCFADALFPETEEERPRFVRCQAKPKFLTMRIRSGPKASCDATGQLEDGEVVRVLEEKGDWVRHAKGWTIRRWDDQDTLMPCEDPDKSKALASAALLQTEESSFRSRRSSVASAAVGPPQETPAPGADAK